MTSEHSTPASTAPGDILATTHPARCGINQARVADGMRGWRFARLNSLIKRNRRSAGTGSVVASLFLAPDAFQVRDAAHHGISRSFGA
jgi:hypothetical protein